MSIVNDFRYDLRLEGADEQTISEFSAALKNKRLGTHISQDPEDPTLFTSEVLGGYSGLFEDTIEEDLHSLAVQFPSIKLCFNAEDLDNSSYAYELMFQGDMYQRSQTVSQWQEPFPPVAFAQRREAQLRELDRQSVAKTMVETLCKKTDYDLLYAQKKTLLNSLVTGDPVPKEVLQGLINFLDQVGDLGEVLGYFQYDGIEPPFPMQETYQKREVTIPPALPQKIHLFCEEFEDDNAIREFTILGVSKNEEDLKKLLQSKIEKDEYGFISGNGVKDQGETYFCTEYDDGFVKYYIQEEEILTNDRIQALLKTKAYDPTFHYPENFSNILVETLRQITSEKGFDQLVDFEKASAHFMEDKAFQGELKNTYWFSSTKLSSQAPAERFCRYFILENLNSNPDFFINIGAMEKANYPDNLKDILIGSIYDVCRDRHLSVNHADELADQYMRTAAFREQFKHLKDKPHLEEASQEYQDAVWGCYDFAEDQILDQESPQKDSKSLDDMLRVADRKRENQISQNHSINKNYMNEK